MFRGWNHPCKINGIFGFMLISRKLKKIQKKVLVNLYGFERSLQWCIYIFFKYYIFYNPHPSSPIFEKKKIFIWRKWKHFLFWIQPYMTLLYSQIASMGNEATYRLTHWLCCICRAIIDKKYVPLRFRWALNMFWSSLK